MLSLVTYQPNLTCTFESKPLQTKTRIVMMNIFCVTIEQSQYNSYRDCVLSRVHLVTLRNGCKNNKLNSYKLITAA